MKRKKQHILLNAALPFLVLAIGGCEAAPDADSAQFSTDTPVSPEATDLTTDITDNQESHYDSGDLEYDDSEVVQILLDGTSASADSDDVAVDGSTITITAAGVYSLSGTLTDGGILVETSGDDDVILILDGVDVTNSDGAAIAVMNADEVTVILAEGSTNRLTDGHTYTFPDTETDEPNAALYSADDLTIAGAGELIVSANYNDGITSKDGLVVVSGTIRVVAVDDGIRGKDHVVIGGATIAIEAGGDGIKSDNDEDAERGYVQITDGAIDIASGDDGVQGATDVLITGGQLTIDAGYGSDAGRAILGEAMVVVSGGVIEATAVDDAIHSNDEILIDGGDLTLASGDDGVHGDYLVTIAGGSVTIAEAFEGIESEVIVIDDGFIDITSNDDGLNVASAEATTTSSEGFPGGGGGGGAGGGEVIGDYYIYINGGTTAITVTGELAEQGDGIDANGHVRMTGGVVAISGPTDTRNSAVDYGTFVMSGGLFIGTNIDGRNSQGLGTGSTQASIYVTSDSTVSAGTVVHIETTDGEGLVTFEPANAYDVILFSSPDLVDGERYDVYFGGTVTGESATYLYEDSAYTVGEFASTVTASL